MTDGFGPPATNKKDWRIVKHLKTGARPDGRSSPVQHAAGVAMIDAPGLHALPDAEPLLSIDFPSKSKRESLNTADPRGVTVRKVGPDHGPFLDQTGATVRDPASGRKVEQGAVGSSTVPHEREDAAWMSKCELSNRDDAWGASDGRPEVMQGCQQSTPYDLQDMLYFSGMASMFLDHDLNLLFFTAAAKAFFHIRATDIGQPLANLSSVSNDPELLIEARSVIETRQPTASEIEGPGETWFMRRILPYRAQKSVADGVVITYADISEVKAAARQVEAARAYSESLINTLRRPMAILDDRLMVLFANPAFYATFDTDPARTIGQDFDLLTNPLTASPAFHDFLCRVRSDPSPFLECEIDAVLRSHGPRRLLLKALRIDGGQSEVSKILLVSEDVTERTCAAVALEAAMRQADEANRGKSRFLAAASHDLRQPLQTMSLLRSLLAIKVTDGQALQLLTRLDDTISVMSGILNTLLDIDQIESGVVQIDPVDFRVSDLLQRLGAEFSDHIMARGIEWRVMPSSETIYSDPRLLAEMLRNLISNAVKYTERGRILLGCRRRGRKLRIEVWDTGVGMSEAEMRTVFEDFRQLDNPTRERSRGFGLGLPIVRRLAELLGHDVSVDSIPGKGSAFGIEVPLRSQGSEGVVQNDPFKANAIAPQPAAILVIEDDPDVRGLLQLVLRDKGHHVSVAVDGPQALAFVAEHDITPDLIIADYNLPGSLNGLETISRLREKRGNLPAIVLTGDILTKRLQNIDGQNYIRLTKPVKIEELTRQIDLLLTKPVTALTSTRNLRSGGANHSPGTVFVIDDDSSIRETMHELLDANGWAAETYPTCEAFLGTDHPDRKGCVLVDARLPGMSGLNLLHRLKKESHRLPTVMITGHGDIRMAVAAMAAGALDFIEKPVRQEELLPNIERAFELMADSSKSIISREAAATKVAKLTTRQRQIMDLVLSGQPSKNIAADLGISQRTVENHRAAIMKKMEAASLPELIRAGIMATESS